MAAITITGVRCGGCGASLSPLVEDTWDSFQTICTCGHVNVVDRAAARPAAPPRPDVVGLALSECVAAFEGLSSHGRAREVVEALRQAPGGLRVDAITRARLERIMRRG